MNEKLTDQIADEVRTEDNRFSEYARIKGVAEAFSIFCSPSAIHISSNGYPTVGREKIVENMKKFELSYTMEWEPQIAKVNDNGKTAVTKGTYHLFKRTENEKPNQIETGQYLTVWQKQKTGEWKVIYDMDGGIFHT
jgi:ketosteroid isomerase-like protein